MTEAVRIQTGRNMEWLDAGEMVKCLNQKLDTATLFLLNKDGVTIIRQPRVEQEHQAELMAQSSN